MEGKRRSKLRRTARVAFTIIAGSTLLACASPYGAAPVATNFPASSQPKLQAAAHWAIVAEKSAEALMRSLAPGGGACADPGAICPRVYVRPAAQQTVFAQNFRAAFITALVGHKVAVVHTPSAGAVAIDIDVQTVRFSPDRQNRFLPATAVYAGAWAVYGLAANASPAARQPGRRRPRRRRHRRRLRRLALGQLRNRQRPDAADRSPRHRLSRRRHALPRPRRSRLLRRRQRRRPVHRSPAAVQRRRRRRRRAAAGLQRPGAR